MIVSSSSSSSSQPSAAVDNNSKLTRLDRNIDVILKNPDQTPSRQAGITPEVERLHRFHGTTIIFECSRGLSLGPSTNATACTIFHRFYHSTSLIEYDVWSVAMASTLLATKVEEDAKNLKQIIEVYTTIYARRLMLADVSLDDEGKNDESNDDDEKVKNNKTSSSTKQQELVLSSTHLCCLSESISKWATAKQRQRICADRLPQQLNKFGPMYKEWHAQITKMESILLRQLGFTFYWISDSHPHKFILNFCQALELDDNQVSLSKLKKLRQHIVVMNEWYRRRKNNWAFFCVDVLNLFVTWSDCAVWKRFINTRIRYYLFVSIQYLYFFLPQIELKSSLKVHTASLGLL